MIAHIVADKDEVAAVADDPFEVSLWKLDSIHPKLILLLFL